VFISVALLISYSVSWSKIWWN